MLSWKLNLKGACQKPLTVLASLAQVQRGVLSEDAQSHHSFSLVVIGHASQAKS